MNREYIAGFFDGEGWITISRDKAYTKYRRKYPKYYLRVGIQHTNRFILEQIAKIYGGSIHNDAPREGRHQMFQWALKSGKAVRFLEDLKDFLIIKKPQALLGTEFYKHCREYWKNNSNRLKDGLSLAELRIREKFKQKIQALNSINRRRKSPLANCISGAQGTLI
jgi:hypothetical protein